MTAHAQKPDFVFQRNRLVHLNRPVGGVSSVDYCAAEVCASAVVKLDTPSSEVVYRVLATHSTSFPFTSPIVCHRVQSHFNWSLRWSTIAGSSSRSKVSHRVALTRECNAQSSTIASRFEREDPLLTEQN